jgi:NADH-quinone oxidoreductase subunit M
MLSILFLLLISVIVILFTYLFLSVTGIISFLWDNLTFSRFKNLCLICVCNVSTYSFIFFIYLHVYWLNDFNICNNLVFDYSIELFFKNITISLINTDLVYSSIFSITLSKYNVSFLLLFSIIYPVIFMLMSYDYNYINYKFYLFMIFIFILSFILILTNNIVIFYFTYEIILILIFSVMYISSNSRGGIEAALFFAGWAILGSIFVSLGFIILLTNSNVYLFTEMNLTRFTSDETYYIYLLFFFGFGVKLSIWPLWYWLPKAHVEVSTSMSIFLSCILIKLSFFCLMKVKYILLSEIPLNICILITFICTFEVTIRLINLKDLKAIIAYSSVLHTNLLLLLIHLDSFQILNNSILYIWGHSLSTTCMFLVVNLIESKFGSRSILQVSGLWYVSQPLGLLTFWSLVSFLGLPITLFFWGEIWLWVLVINKITITGTQVLFLAGVIFLSIFFKIWWNVMYGVPAKIEKVNDAEFFYIELLVMWLLILQYLIGAIPMILISSVGFSS